MNDVDRLKMYFILSWSNHTKPCLSKAEQDNLFRPDPDNVSTPVHAIKGFCEWAGADVEESMVEINKRDFPSMAKVLYNHGELGIQELFESWEDVVTPLKQFVLNHEEMIVRELT